MADFGTIDFGESTFGLQDGDFLALIGASEWDDETVLNSYSYTSFDNDQQFLENIGPQSVDVHPSAMETLNDITEQARLGPHQLLGAPTNDLEPAITSDSPLNNSPSQIGEFSAFYVDLNRRGLEGYLFEFEGPKPKNTSKKGRKPFSKERRKQVGQVRKAGACTRCRITKTPVSVS
jgi:hypothetical protein